MHRVALLAGFVSTGLLAPATSYACCADVHTSTPLGWSADGRVLIGRHSATECSGTSVAEVMEPGASTPSERYDLYSRSARLELDGEARAIDDETLYQEEEAGASPNRYAPSAALRRRFSRRVTTLCGADVLALALPVGQRGADRFDEEVVVSVRVRTEAGFREVLSGVRWQRVTAQAMNVFVHPSPDGTRALVRLHSDGPDAMFDDPHWIELPADTIRSHRCAPEAARAQIFPTPQLADDTYQEDLRWMVDGANEQFDGDFEDGSPSYFANEAAWTKPRDPAIRALLVRAVTRVYGPVLAAAIEAEAPITGAPIAIANDDAIVPIDTGDEVGSSGKAPLSSEEMEAFHGAYEPDASEHDESLPEATFDVDVDYPAYTDPAAPDAGTHFDAPPTEPMACSATRIDAAAFLLLLVPIVLRARARRSRDP
jgi:hypothetical protein